MHIRSKVEKSGEQTRTWTIGPEEVLSAELSLFGVPEGPDPALRAPNISRKYTMSVGEVETTSKI